MLLWKEGFLVNFLLCLIVCVSANSHKYIRRYAGLGRTGSVLCTGPTCYTESSSDALSTGFRNTYAVTGDKYGNIFASDVGNARIAKIWPNGSVESVVGTGVYSPFQFNDGTAGTATGLATVYGLSTDDDGNLYFSEMNGNRIRVLNRNNTVYTVAGILPGLAGDTSDGLSANGSAIGRPFGIHLWQNTNLYFVEFASCKVRYIDEYGLLQTVAGAGGCAVNGDLTFGATIPTLTTLTRARHVWVDSAGAVYFTEVRGFVRKVANGTMRIIAGNANSVSYRYGIAGTSAALGNLRGISGDSRGNIFVGGVISDVYRIDTHTEKVYKLAGASGSFGSVDCGVANSTRLGYVEGLYVDPVSEDVYVADYLYSTIRVISSTGECVPTQTPTLAPFINDTFSPSRQPTMGPSVTGAPSLVNLRQDAVDSIDEPARYISTVVGVNDGRSINYCQGSGCYPKNHVATENTLLYPYAVHVDANGTIFVADTNNYRIVRVDANNTMTTIIGTGLTPATCCDGNDSLATNVGRVYGLSGSSDGVIYFAEYSEARIRAWYPSTNLVYTVAGANPAFRVGFTPDGESIKGGRIAYPWGIFVEDESRTMYYTDNSFCLIRSFSLDTYIVSTIAGSGNCQSSQMYPWQVGRDYYAAHVYTNAVYNVWANKNGEVFFSDSWNFVWRVYNGFARIFAGNGVYDSSAEYVPATSTTIASPRGITGDDFGNIYIVSSGENIVLKVTTNGTMYRIAGSSSWGYVDCTLATLGQMANPQGIAIDTSGNLYVADSSAHTIRRISETAYCSPTPTPTEAPSGPTMRPTIVKTAAPTVRPSWRPTTIKPSRRPTRMPTPRPTRIPTSQPSASPTSWPSSRPSVQPSSKPSGQPSAHPSSQPSRQPSDVPSSQPSAQPTVKPSTEPSPAPSSRPSSRPSLQPTRQPSSQPSSLPTDMPTSKPSSQPSRHPSSQPSHQPISSPSAQPTGLPSGHPSSQPTRAPSTHPTSQPSRSPTTKPSSKPSTRPTRQPTDQPSCQPTSSPSCQPLTKPTGGPSGQPSAQPVSKPSSQPTSQPSSQPTSRPTLKTKAPTVRPTTAMPSRLPTLAPTFAVGIVGVYAVSAQLSNDGLSCAVALNVATNQAGKSGVFSCADVLVLSPVGTFTCTWSNTSALTIQLSAGSSSTFGIGSQVGLIGGLSTLRPLSLADGQTFSVAGRMVTVRSPVQPVRPSVVIKASTTISSCADWSIDLTGSTGNAGRTWTNTSVSVSLVPAAADNSSAVLASRLLSSLSTSFPMTVPNAWLTSGVQYSVSLRLCNYLGGCGVSTVKVFVSNTSLSAPVVSILGNAAVSTYVNRSITVAASAYVPLCFGQQRTSGLSYTWSVWSGSSQVTVVNRAADPSTLMLAAYALTANGAYTVRVVVEDSRSQLSSQATMSLTTLSSALVARISPAVSSVLGVGQSVTLDASSSFDPDSASATLSYSWTTTLVSSVTGAVVTSDSPIALQVTNKSSSSIRSVALVTGVEYVANVTAIVRVTVSSGSKTGSASTAFRIVSEPIPSVAISTTAAAVTNVDASRSVSLVGSVQASSTTTATWSVTGLSSSTLTAMVAGGTTSFAVTANRAASATLFLLPNALDAGAKYVFTLTCGKATVSIAVSTNYPPYGGQLATNPSVGYSLQTSFALSTSDWVDSDLPLQYAFKFYSVATTSWLSIQSVSPASYCASVLPTGAEQTQYLVNVSVRAYDSYGAAAFLASIDTVTVKPIPAAQVAGVITSLLGNASSASAIQQVVSVGSAALNTVNCTGVSASHCQTVLHRAACSSTSFTCGACLDGYVGITGDSNVPCYALTSVSGRRRRLTATHCTSNSDCSAWQTCATTTGLCKDRGQTCPRDCSGHGTCQWRSTVTGALVSSCSVIATDCEATCVCSAGYGGLDCSHTSSDWQREQAVRASMMQSLETSVQQTNLDEASVASVALNVASLISSAASVSEANAATTVSVATALVEAAAASSASIPATSLTRLLSPLDHALRHVANRTVSEAAVNASVIVQTLEAYAATAAVAALPDADATTAVHSMYRLSTQAFALSTTGTLNSSLSVPTTDLEAAQSVTQTNLRLQTNLSSSSEDGSLLASANAIAVQLMEYPQRVLAATTAATVKSNLVSVATHALDATGDVLGEVSTFDIEIVHTTSIALSNVSSAVHYFDVNCTTAMTQNVTKVCPGSNHTLTFACNGQRSGVWRKYCPVLQPTCYGLTAQEAFAASSSSSLSLGSSASSTDADRVSCVPTTVTSESTVCTCTIPASRRRRRLTAASNAAVEQKADYLAVIVTYVAGNFVDTFEETNSVGPDVLQKSYIVLALYGSLWVSCAIFMVVLYRKAQIDEAKKREAAIQRRHHSRVSPSVAAGSVSAASGGAVVAMPVQRRRGGIGPAALMATPGAASAAPSPPAAVDATTVAAAGAAAAVAGPPSTPLTKQVLRGKLLSYIESIIPKVFDDKPALLRLVQEMSRNHVYVKLVVEGLTDRRSYVDVFKMMTTFTVLMFLLALMYDLQYPSDDGSCPAHLTELTCLSRKSLLDNAQSYCQWDVSNGDCAFNANINVSFTDAAVCAVVTSWITSILTRPLGYLFELLNAPSTEELRNAAHASSAFEKLHASVMTGVRRASVAMHSILPTARSDTASAAAKKNTLILHTTHIPEDTHEARKEIRVAMQELEQRQPGTSRLASTLHRSRMASLSKMAAPSVDMNGSDAAELDTDVVLSPQMILHALRQQRSRLTGAKLDDFDRAWYFLLHYDQWRVDMDAERRAQWMARLISACADGGRRARVRREGLPTRVEDFVGQLLVDTVTSTVEETRIVDGLTDVEAGLHILQTFVRDILGQHTSVAKIFLAKAQAEFYRTNAVSRRVKALAIAVILGVNGFCLYFSIVRGYVKGLHWQAAYAMSCVIQLATEVLFFETLETMWVDFLLPNFAFAEMRRCHGILRAMVDSLTELMESEALQVRRGGGSGEGVPPAPDSPCVLNVPQHFYISNQLARRNPTLIESMMVLSYESYLPVGLDTGSDLTNGGADDVVGMHRRGLFCISWVSYFSATFLALVAVVPFEFHRLVIRFFSPFLVGGLVLAWAYISVSALFLGLFFGGVGVIALYAAYVVWKLHRQAQVVEGTPVEPRTTQQSKLPLGGAAYATTAPAAEARSAVVPVTHVTSPTESMPALSPVYPRHVRSPASSSPSRDAPLSATEAVKAAAARLANTPSGEEGKDDRRHRDEHQKRDAATTKQRPSLHEHRRRREVPQNHSSDSDDGSRSDSSDSDSSDGDGEMSLASFLSFDVDGRSRSGSLVDSPSESSKKGHRRNRSEEESLDTMPLPSESSLRGLRHRVSSNGSSHSSTPSNTTLSTNTSAPVRLVKQSLVRSTHSRPAAPSEPMFFAHELPDKEGDERQESMVAAPTRPRNASKSTPAPRVSRPKK